MGDEEEVLEGLTKLCQRHKFRDPEPAAEVMLETRKEELLKIRVDELLEIRREYYEDELVRRFLPLLEHFENICDELESLGPESKAQLAALITLHVTPRSQVDLADAFIEAVKTVGSFVAERKKPSQSLVGRPPKTRRDALLAPLALFHERHTGIPFRESNNDTAGRRFVADAAIEFDPDLDPEEVESGMRSIGRWLSSSGPGLAAQRHISTDDNSV